MLLACSGEPAEAPPPEPGEGSAVAEPPPAEAAAEAEARAEEAVPLVLLVSWDTTRADALGAWSDVSHWDTHWAEHGDGRPAPVPRTPAADALAARGVRFRWALSHSPTTLSAHASLMSGLDPHGHQVVRNGFPVPASVPLLAERFEAAGWHTVGVVGASVLEARMGLDRGFAVYDDAVQTEVRRRVEDRAAEVLARTLAHVDARPPDKPLFLFVHFFDAHSPWDSAPAALREAMLAAGPDSAVDGSDESIQALVAAVRADRLAPADAWAARALYLAEVAAQDAALAELLEALEARGFMADRVVALVGDHGEALEDAPAHPYGHGPDVDLPLIHVPMVLESSRPLAGRPRQGVVVDTPVSLSDLPGALLELAGLEGGLGEGRPLSGLVASAAHRAPSPELPPHFAEATKPFEVLDRTGAWPNLPLERAAVARGHILLAAPWDGGRSQLYRLAPGQPEGGGADLHRHLLGALQAWDRAAPGGRSVQLHPETRAALEALGYLSPSKP